jgi:uncharacterized protein YcbK (DUF882 family)
MHNQITTYFNSKEFDSPDVKFSGKKMQFKFVRDLNRAREIAKIPFIINSGYRTLAHNNKVGGLPDSSHLYGSAADIKVSSSRQRCVIVRALILAGFTRIGIGVNFIHVDSDPDKITNVMWLY